MRVYIFDADVGHYCGVTPVGKQGLLEFTQRFDGSPLGRSWTGNEKFRFIHTTLLKGDTPGLASHIPVFSPRAVKVLAHLLESCGELLPITCEEENLFVFNVTRIVDALDETNCELERFADGRILEIDRYSFVERKLVGATIFKLPQRRLSWTYVTEPFVNRVHSMNLKGFRFRLVWSSGN